ncbi:MAG TPA: flagellar hook capping FlgD N-terminal domain-containing protein, partial [Candidatus Saccharimonadales bacterium]|nr:flagellar hook capping FlgD N-terminal domain-containing protein [Candidatus Saccharimonadales bacterium]
MITDSVSSASSAAASGLTSTLTGTGSTTLGKDDFLKLLTAQLQHQDPLQPMDNTAFVAQLAQFSSLEQLQNMNSSLSTDILLNQSVNNSLATGLIGRNIVAKGDQITLAAGGTADLSFNLSAAADAKITVVDSSGKTVATLTPGHLGAGDQTVTWN